MHEFKVALVTGSTQGIGKAIAIALAKNGYSIVINDEITEDLPKDYKDILKEIYQTNPEEKYLLIKADVSRSEDRDKIVSQLKEKFGRIDVLVNNAGIAPKERKDILIATEESFDLVMSVNLKGPYFLTQKIANWMIDLKSTIKDYQPYIINISSISSFTSSPSRGEYCVSKAGVTMMTKLYADRLAEYDIPVYEIQPGIIKTPMTEAVREKYDKLIGEGLTPIKRWGLPEDIAKTVLGIVHGNIPFSTGEIIHVDGGFHLRRL